MNKIFKKFFLFIFLLFFTFLSSHADSTKIYKKEYQNPIGVLNSFLWNDKQGGYIGLTPKINISSRNLNHTIHPVSIDSFKIKAAFSKLKYKNIENEKIYHIFNTDNLEVLSKNISRGLLISNNLQDIIFQFVHDNKKKFVITTKGIAFVEKNSLNLVFFTIHECKTMQDGTKKRSHYRRSQIFPKKNINCENNKKEILVTSKKGIYKKEINDQFSWLIFTPQSWQVNSIN